MAQKLSQSSNEAKFPTFSRESKMRRYDIIYDPEVKQMRAAFFNDTFGNIQIDQSSFNDKYWVVEPGFEYRTDLISKKFYETSKYDWIIEKINNIRDPIKDVKVGTKLKIISFERMMSYV
jgi:hypothetical protein